MGQARWSTRHWARACAAALPGTHDFTAFTPTETDHVRFERDIRRAEWTEEGEILAFWVEADAFMRNMVRVLVGTMLEVAAGQRGVEEFANLLGGARREQAICCRALMLPSQSNEWAVSSLWLGWSCPFS